MAQHWLGFSSPHLDLVLSGVSTRARSNLAIHGVKFDSKLTFEDHVRGIVSHVSQRIDILILHNAYLSTPLSYFVGILHLFSQSLSIVLRCAGQLLNITFSFLSSRCIRWAGVVPIRVSCRSVIDGEWLSLVSCTRLIRTLIAVCSASFHLLQLAFDIPSCGAAHPLEFAVVGVERPKI